MRLSASKRYWIPIIVTVAIGITPLLISVLWPRQKELAYNITTWGLPPAVNLSGLEMRVGKRVLSNPAFQTIHIENIGKIPILRADFDGPILVELPAKAELFDARVSKRTPADLPIQIEQHAQQLSIKPLLLNPGDIFEIEVMSNNPTSSLPTVLARITGVAKLSSIEIAKGQRRTIAMTVVALSLLLVYTVFGGYLSSTIQLKDHGTLVPIGRMECIFAAAAGLFGSIILGEDASHALNMTLGQIVTVVVLFVILGTVWGSSMGSRRKNALKAALPGQP